jgi:hypothetical protein
MASLARDGMRAEARLLARAAKEWELTPEIRAEVIDRAMTILRTSDDTRAKVHAIHALAAMDRCNIEREKLATGKRVHHEHSGMVGHVSASGLTLEQLLALRQELEQSQAALPPPSTPSACAQTKEAEATGPQG